MYSATGKRGGLNGPPLAAPPNYNYPSPLIDPHALGLGGDGNTFSPGSMSIPLGLTPLQTPTPSLSQNPFGSFIMQAPPGIPPPPTPDFDSRKQKNTTMQVMNKLVNFERNGAAQQQKQQAGMRGAIPSRPGSNGMFTGSSSGGMTSSAAAAGVASRDGSVYVTNFQSNVAGSMQQGLAPGGGAPYFESPMLSVDFQSRPLSPPQSKSYGDGGGGGGGGGLGGDFRHKQRKAETVLSNLQGAERHDAQKKRGDEAQGPPATRLFAPVDSPYSLSMPPSSGPGSNSHGAAPPPGALTNMLMSSRLSSSGMGRTSAIMDDALDLGMSQDPMMYSSLFSPGNDLHRALPVGESPKMGQNHMMFPYPGTYLSQPTPTAQTWQFPHHQQHHGNGGLMNLSTPAFPTGSMLESNQGVRQSSGRGISKEVRRTSSSKRSRRRSDEGDEDGDEDYDEDDEDEEEASKPKRKKKAAKPSDPNEPKITSKHRGVCWYKRTKKWVVQTKVNGKRVHVGYFDDEEKAAEAYKKAVQGIQIKKALEAKQRSMTPGSDAGPPALEPGLPIPDAPSTSGLNL